MRQSTILRTRQRANVLAIIMAHQERRRIHVL